MSSRPTGLPILLAALVMGCANPQSVETCLAGPWVGVYGPVDDVFASKPLRFRAPEGVDASFGVQLVGMELAGDWTVNGGSHVFAPDQPLQPAMTYTWTSQVDGWCAGEPVSFTTSDLGLPVDPEAFIGRTFDLAIDISDGGHHLLLVNPEHPPLELRIDQIDGTAVQVTLGVGSAPGINIPQGQDACQPTIPVQGEWLDESRLVLSGDSLPLPLGYTSLGGTVGFEFTDGGPLQLDDWSLEVVAHRSADAVSVVRLAFTADTRDLWTRLVGDMEGDSEDGERYCELVEFLGARCEPCPDGLVSCLSEEFSSHVAGLEAPPLIDVAVDQTENHLCDASCDNTLDDDGDGDVDDDAECEPMAWP